MATALTTCYSQVSFSFVQPNGNILYPNTLTGTQTCKRDFTSGVTANKCDRVSVQEYVILASQTLTIDLDAGTYSVSGGGATGSILDPNGVAITFARLKVMYAELEIGASRSNSVKVNGTASNVIATDWTAGLASDGTKNVAASITRNTAAGWVLTPSTADKVVVVNNDAAVAYVILGLAGGAT